MRCWSDQIKIALSRDDNKTEICSDCGIKEALALSLKERKN